jgi:hypothetical protein
MKFPDEPVISLQQVMRTAPAVTMFLARTVAPGYRGGVEPESSKSLPI